MFMDQTGIQHTNFQKSDNLHTHEEIVRSLEFLETDSRDPWIINCILLKKLYPDIRQLWATKLIETNKSTLKDLFTFLDNRCDHQPSQQ